MRLKAVPAAWSTGSSLRRKKMRKMFEKSKKMFVLLLAIVAVALSGGAVSAPGLSGGEVAVCVAGDLDGTVGFPPYESVVEEIGDTCVSLLGCERDGLTERLVESGV